MSFGELLFLAILALLVFGPRKLPEIARTVAKVMTELRRASNEFKYQMEEELRNIEVTERKAGPAAKLLEAPAGVVGAVARPGPEEEEAPGPAPPAAAAPAPVEEEAAHATASEAH